MILIQLMGGLGNQLFMIFATVSYAIDYNIEYGFISNNNNTVHGPSQYWDNLLKCFQKNVNTQCNDYQNIYKESCYKYECLPHHLSLGNSLIESSYLQSYKYFAHNYDKIIEKMELRQQQADTRNKYNTVFQTKTIAMHFRFGDYLKYKEHHCITPAMYFIKAIKELSQDLDNRGEKIENYKILCFCEPGNDTYVTEFLNKINEEVPSRMDFVRISDEIPDWTQLLMMSCCDHFIITNSSFSWFGAYFSENTEKIVYRPKEWFGPVLKSHDITDLCPTEWKII